MARMGLLGAGVGVQGGEVREYNLNMFHTVVM